MERIKMKFWKVLCLEGILFLLFTAGSVFAQENVENADAPLKTVWINIVILLTAKKTTDTNIF